MPIPNFEVTMPTGPQATAFGEELLREVQKAQPDMDQVDWLASRADLKLTDNQNRTALMTVMSWGNHALVQKLIVNGADLNQKGARGNTAVHFAMTSGNEQNAATVLAYNGNLAQANDADKTPFDFAEGKFKHEMMVKLKERYETQNPDISRRRAFNAHIEKQGVRTEKPTKAPRPAVFKPKR